MNLLEKFEVIYKKIIQVQEHQELYLLHPERYPLSIQDLVWALGDMYGLDIEMLEVSFDGDFLRGMIERYEKRARVLVKRAQSADWKRFTAVKELCHLIIDEPEDWSPRGDETLQDLLADGRGMKDGKGPAVPSEHLAQIAALEMMYPLHHRVADLPRLKGNQTTLTQIANESNLPVAIVDFALAEDYHTLSTSIWAKCDSFRSKKAG